MRNIITVITTLIVLAFYTNKVYAQTQGTVTLSVNVTGVFAIEISPTTIDLGSVQAGGSVTSMNTVTVTTSSTNTVNIKLSLSQGTPSTYSIGTSTPGTDIYVLCGLFNSTMPNTWDFSPGTGTTEDSIIETMRTTNGQNFAGDQDGYDIAPGGSQNLWFKFIAPTVITAPASPLEMSVIITAESM